MSVSLFSFAPVEPRRTVQCTASVPCKKTRSGIVAKLSFVESSNFIFAWGGSPLERSSPRTRETRWLDDESRWPDVGAVEVRGQIVALVIAIVRRLGSHFVALSSCPENRRSVDLGRLQHSFQSSPDLWAVGGKQGLLHQIRPQKQRARAYAVRLGPSVRMDATRSSRAHATGGMLLGVE